MKDFIKKIEDQQGASVLWGLGMHQHIPTIKKESIWESQKIMVSYNDKTIYKLRNN
jgi:hypothetical protein